MPRTMKPPTQIRTTAYIASVESGEEATVHSAEVILDSWKQIAMFLNRDVRTVQRWEKLEGLPVHRHRHQKRCTVSAIQKEVQRWQKSRNDTRIRVPRLGERTLIRETGSPGKPDCTSQLFALFELWLSLMVSESNREEIRRLAVGQGNPRKSGEDVPLSIAWISP